MFLFGIGRGPHARKFFAARVALILAFLLVVFAFHPHGTALDIVQVVRVVLLVALIGSSWLFRRRGAAAAPSDSDRAT